jgi:hypothetical protein
VAKARSDREFPAADAAAPRVHRPAVLRSSPPPASIEEYPASAPRAAVDSPEAEASSPEPAPVIAAARAAARPEPAPVIAEAPAAAPAEVADEPAPSNKVERPLVHESARELAPPAAAPAPETVAALQSRKADIAPVEPEPAKPEPVEPVAAPAPSAEMLEQRGSDDRSVDEPGAVAVAAAAGGYHAGNGNGNGAGHGIEPGEVVTEENMERYAQLLSPGLEWAVRYGWRIKVGTPRRIEMIRPYREATEKYSGQVRLSPDGLRVLNWTAGQPFPSIDTNDPQVALKIMWNYSYSGIATDDLLAENFDADTGTIGKNRGMTVERHYLIDNFRRLLYTGRLFVEPKPNLPNSEDLRYKESLHPLREPFDLKGVGGTFYRYNDPNRQDDSWLYLPQLRRVRRLSTAQRSDALFGQDSDVDSYYGYNGHIAWADWKFLGERTILAAVHGQNVPVQWQQPEDWAFDDVWEPRRVYVIEGTSKLPQYAYGKRVIFIDKEAWVVTHSDIYDRAGQLWKVWVNLYSFKKEVIPGAVKSRYPDEMGFIHAIVMLDTQLVHATKAALPSTHSRGEECVFFNMGEKSGTTEEFFTVAHLIESGH